ncbi:MAG: alpha-amylase family glycosyl hydrolase [Acidimicrobiaceae bacterium]|nr:alpha-amylase family glycosyl hydrolase [Acidimicrobiaceae bacterium]
MISSSSEQWWAGAAGYQIYIRSFADSNDDGVGDLEGIRSKLGYLSDLGVDFVWITPFYPTPGDDWGYDVADYCDVDPLFGDLDTFDRLVAEAHDRGIRIVTDLVPNHSSSSHRWFQAALGNSGAADRERYRDYYIWRDPPPGGGPPNNWVGYFGGPAWTLDPDSGQYYLHLFLPSQPDLNWRNPAVGDEWEGILRFWLDRGVSGFRVDVAGGLVKDALLRSNPQLQPIPPGASRWEQWDCFEHLHDVFQPESQEVFRRWRAICDRYGAFLHGETYHLDPRGMDALLPPDGMHGGYWFAPMHIEWSADTLWEVLSGPGDLADRLLWAAGSHDMPRAPTRFGGGEAGRERTLAMNVLFAFAPGVPVLYQGEELGLGDGHVAPESKLDPVGPDSDVAAGRDGCRTPMPWMPGPFNGFSAVEPWLLSEPRPREHTAAAQEDDEASYLNSHRRLLAVRRRLFETEGLAGEAADWGRDGDGAVIVLRRGSVVAAANTADTETTVQLPAGSELMYETPASTCGASAPLPAQVRLAPRSAIVCRTN